MENECTEGGKKLLARAVLSVAILLTELLESLWLIEFTHVMIHRLVIFFYCLIFFVVRQINLMCHSYQGYLEVHDWTYAATSSRMCLKNTEKLFCWIKMGIGWSWALLLIILIMLILLRFLSLVIALIKEQP